MKPARDMDRLLTYYGFEADVSNIQPMSRLLDMMGFYTSELSRVLVEIAKSEAYARALATQMKQRRARLVTHKGARTRWQADAQAADDPRYKRMEDELSTVESSILILKALSKSFEKIHETLSREETARVADRARYDGRGGGAQP